MSASIVPIEPAGVKRFERIGAHSHIKGLGLDSNGKALKVADGMVGQTEAREAAGFIVKLVKEGKMAGRGVLIIGPSGTGKTAIAVAIARELGSDVPFMILNGSEIYSTEMKKTEVLMQATRKAIGIRIKEMRKIYEGVVKHLDFQMGTNPYNPYQQVPKGARITLKTKSEERALRVGPEIAEELVTKGVEIGDVIWLDAETGRVTKVGRAKDTSVEIPIGEDYDVTSTKRVEVPAGPIYKDKEFVYTLTLHDLDEYYAQRGGGLISIFFGTVEREISSDVRQKVDEEVKKLIEEGKGELLPGVLFIDDVHMLDIEALSFMSRTIESEFSPIVILATNRGMTKIRGTDLEAPHGLPLDLLDRLLIISTRQYQPDEVREILKIRAKEENVKLSEDALEKLTKIGAEMSLRYAVQLITPANIAAKSKGRDSVSGDDVDYVKNLFFDITHSVKYIKEYEEKLLK
ncbi:MAG: RuvB-like helicase [Thermoprotei archaeon]